MSRGLRKVLNEHESFSPDLFPQSKTGGDIKGLERPGLRSSGHNWMCGLDLLLPVCLSSLCPVG